MRRSTRSTRSHTRNSKKNQEDSVLRKIREIITEIKRSNN